MSTRIRNSIGRKVHITTSHLNQVALALLPFPAAFSLVLAPVSSLAVWLAVVAHSAPSTLLELLTVIKVGARFISTGHPHLTYS